MVVSRAQLVVAMFTVLIVIGPAEVSAQEYEVTDLGALGVTNTTWSVNSLGRSPVTPSSQTATVATCPL